MNGPLVIDAGALRDLLDSTVPVRLVHALGPDDFRDGHIPGAVAAPCPATVATRLVPGELLVVYGATRACTEARRIAAQLARRHPVRLLDGGLDAWRAIGGPVEGAPG
ncbi:MAG TPA: rhodanese-like domain-containing protein [Jiangellales bacterium]|nr:rhodanese-like domain-containing protein [Jiangellales bacterium]